MSFLRTTPRSTKTPQSQPLDRKQVPNNAGGYVYTVDSWDQLHRFLTIGSQGGTYYVGQDNLTEQGTALIETLLKENYMRVVNEAIDVSTRGLAVKQDYAIYALALALSSDNIEARVYAYEGIRHICRTASTLFQLVSYLKGRRGWSMGLRKAIARWYKDMPVDKLAYQMVKYRERNGFKHRDVMLLASPKPGNKEQEALFAWAAASGKDGFDYQKFIESGKVTSRLPETVINYEATKFSENPDRQHYASILPREALPTDWLNDPKVWEALLPGMPYTALLRNLGNLSKHGVLKAHTAHTEYVVGRLSDADAIRKARVHPIAIFLASRIYATGKSIKGSGEWAPVGVVLEALERAFYESFVNVEATGKHIIVAVDASGSMTSPVMGLPLSARKVALAMALITVCTEPNARLIGFTDGHPSGNRYDPFSGWYYTQPQPQYLMTNGGVMYPNPHFKAPNADPKSASSTFELLVAGDERLRDVETRFSEKVEGRGTDVAEPLKWAATKGLDLDAVVIYTDTETWAGNSHPQAKLEAARRRVGHNVKMVVAATAATGHTVGDPSDKNVLQVSGFDSSVPQVIADFLR